MNKILLIFTAVFLIVVTAGVSCSSLHEAPVTILKAEAIEKVDCPRDEWNQNFEDWRAGLIPKDDMIRYVRGCKW